MPGYVHQGCIPYKSLFSQDLIFLKKDGKHIYKKEK